MSELAPWIAIVVSLAVFGFSVWTHNSKVSTQRMRNLEVRIEHKAEKNAVETLTMQAALIVGRVDMVEDRSSRMEERFKYLPDINDSHAMALSISQMRGDVQALAQRVAELVRLIERQERDPVKMSG